MQTPANWDPEIEMALVEKAGRGELSNEELDDALLNHQISNATHKRLRRPDEDEKLEKEVGDAVRAQRQLIKARLEGNNTGRVGVPAAIRKLQKAEMTNRTAFAMQEVSELVQAELRSELRPH